ncbi:MAG TPA: hypothetical protein VNP04_05755 [Alphaproteobacteria bacterium]|nr:hypothetical protein [Alphaproteobacteria bacterium]
MQLIQAVRQGPRHMAVIAASTLTRYRSLACLDQGSIGNLATMVAVPDEQWKLTGKY